MIKLTMLQCVVHGLRLLETPEIIRFGNFMIDIFTVHFGAYWDLEYIVIS